MLFLVIAAFAGEVVLQLSDPDSLLGRAPAVTINKGQQLFPRDDGQKPDANPNDRVFTATLTDPTVPIRIDIRDGTRGWSTEVSPGSETYLMVKLKADSQVETTFTQVASTGGEAGTPAGGTQPGGAGGTGPQPVEGTPSPAPPPQAGGGGQAAGNALETGASIGGSAVVALLLGIGLVMLPMARLRRAQRVVQVVGAPDYPRVPPQRFLPDQLEAVVAHYQPTHRIVLVGTGVEGAIRIEDARILPEEVVQLTEQLAATQGLPLALLVTDASRMEASGKPPVETLSERVAERFPLLVASGPEAWTAFGATE